MSILFKTELHDYPLPEDDSCWEDEGGKPYLVRYTTRNAVYFMHKGKEGFMSLANWLEQMTPINLEERMNYEQ